MNLQPWIRFYRGRILERLGRTEAAAGAYRDALAADPRMARAADALGYLHAGRKDYAAAERWLSESVRLAPRNAHAWFNLGFVREAQGRHQEAIEAFSESVRLNPLFDRAWYGMGMCHATLGRHEEAAKSLGEAATLQPMNGFAWYQLGMAYHALRQPEKVKEVVEHMFRYDPRMTRRLIQDARRDDLAFMVKDLVA